jgi:hypothetical protein
MADFAFPKPYQGGSVALALSQGGGSADVNLLPIPTAWGDWASHPGTLMYYIGYQFFFYDTVDLSPTGNPTIYSVFNPSIPVDGSNPTPSQYAVYAPESGGNDRELDSLWINVNPGDYIEAVFWAKVGPSVPTNVPISGNQKDTDYRHGARFGTDMLTKLDNGNWTIVDGVGTVLGDTPPSGSHVPPTDCIENWSDTPAWHRHHWKVQIPTATYTSDYAGNTFSARHISGIAPNIDVRGGTVFPEIYDAGHVLFGDIEFYLNPTVSHA